MINFLIRCVVNVVAVLAIAIFYEACFYVLGFDLSRLQFLLGLLSGVPGYLIAEWVGNKLNEDKRFPKW